MSKKNLLSVLRDESGVFTFLVAGAAAGLLALAIAILSINKGSKMGGSDAVRFYSAIDVIKANIYFFGQNPQAWARTLAYNRAKMPARMVNIDTGVNCTVPASFGSDEKVDLVLPDNTLYYETTTLDLSTTANLTLLTGESGTKDGFRYDGQVCNYTQDYVSSACAIQLDLRWRPFCDVDCPCGLLYNRIAFHGFWRTPNQTATAPSPPYRPKGFLFNARFVNGVISQ